MGKTWSYNKVSAVVSRGSIAVGITCCLIIPATVFYIATLGGDVSTFLLSAFKVFWIGGMLNLVGNMGIYLMFHRKNEDQIYIQEHHQDLWRKFKPFGMMNNNFALLLFALNKIDYNKADTRLNDIRGRYRQLFIATLWPFIFSILLFFSLFIYEVIVR